MRPFVGKSCPCPLSSPEQGRENKGDGVEKKSAQSLRSHPTERRTREVCVLIEEDQAFPGWLILPREQKVNSKSTLVIRLIPNPKQGKSNPGSSRFYPWKLWLTLTFWCGNPGDSGVSPGTTLNWNLKSWHLTFKGLLHIYLLLTTTLAGENSSFPFYRLEDWGFSHFHKAIKLTHIFLPANSTQNISSKRGIWSVIKLSHESKADYSLGLGHWEYVNLCYCFQLRLLRQFPACIHMK